MPTRVECQLTIEVPDKIGMTPTQWAVEVIREALEDNGGHLGSWWAGITRVTPREVLETDESEGGLHE